MSERIDYNKLNNDPVYKDFESKERAGTDGITVNIDRLIELTERHPVEIIDLEHFFEQLGFPCWTDAEGNEVTPHEIIECILNEGYDAALNAHPHFYKHIIGIRDADRRYPIHVHDEHIINGMHRLAQIYIDQATGKSTQSFLTAKKLSHIPEEALLEDQSQKPKPN